MGTINVEVGDWVRYQASDEVDDLIIIHHVDDILVNDWLPYGRVLEVRKPVRDNDGK